MRHELIRLGMSHPGDVSELEKLLQSGSIKAGDIKGIIAQTEGDGYARGYSTLAFQVLLAPYLGWSHQQIFDRIPMMMIGKTGGLMSPHYTLLFRKESSAEAAPATGKRFVFGVASSRQLKPEEIGTTAQVDLTAEAVRDAIADAGIESLEDVHCVEIKCPWGVGGTRSKAASALGSGVALGEIDRERIGETAINGDHELYSLRTSVSAGGEQTAVRIIVMGNRRGSDSPLVVASGVMRDSFDLPGLYRVFDELGMPASPALAESDRSRVRQVFVNAGADALNHIRGQRHTIHSDALSMHSGIVAKAVAHAVVGALVGDAAILCSAGSEHQGPQGANLIAAVVEAAAEGGVTG
ncbi:ring-opening amidohydrolase [Paenibacillus soyae]|uniref:Cyclic amide hydrolase n=1 Tax=Paenibacillus soyae TaxID=2969249 RepID=A0A9X2MSN2_9BACL|nr:ring-opening amidohydrolase [Paenibacillus soyae]MCR2805690.1 amidohydrolase [Paenibacillus soyae]